MRQMCSFSQANRISTFCAHDFNSVYSMNWRFDIILFHLKWHPFDRTLALIFCMLSAYVIRISLVPFTMFAPNFVHCFGFTLTKYRLWAKEVACTTISLALAAIKTGHCVSINSWLKYHFVCFHFRGKSQTHYIDTMPTVYLWFRGGRKR